MSNIYKNKETGKHYEVWRMDLINCTNANDGDLMVIYKNKKDHALTFVREKQEFLDKFELTDFDELDFGYGDMFDDEGFLIEKAGE